MKFVKYQRSCCTKDEDDDENDDEESLNPSFFIYIL